ncbi:MAG: hypothetical protein AABY87_07520 [bacterium]
MSEGIRRIRRWAPILKILFLVFLCAIPFLTGSAMADSIRGLLDLGYSNSETKTEDNLGQKAQTASDSFTQQYRLNMSKNLYPNLLLNAGGIFDKTKNISETDDVETRSTATRSRPFADLTLRTPLYYGGILYNKREDKFESPDSLTSINFNEDYGAILGWKPEGFPSLDMRYDKIDTYDQERLFQDISSERVLWNLAYATKHWDFRYQPTYNDTVNKIADLETKNTNHSGRLTYSDSLRDGQTSVYTSYYISRNQTETIAHGLGEVDFQLFPFSGLSAPDDSPSEGALDDNSALVDGGLTASSGVNIGLPTIGGDTRPRNMGLDFFNDTEVNTLYVWVDQELPAAIAESFSWDIYTSDDNLNWVFQTTIMAAPFGPFENRFELRFPNKTTRYIKAVVSPLSGTVPGAVALPDIFVTEIQAFLSKPAQDVKGKVIRTSQLFSTDVRSRLMDIPSLYYEFSYGLSKVDPSSQRRSNLSNGFSVTHRFSEVFSGAGRVAREDIDESETAGSAYVYNASLRAEPLKTLSHTLLFSGRKEELGAESQDKNSIFLQNRAQLYRGLNAFLHGGLSRISAASGEKQDGTSWDFGISAAPHTSLTLTFDIDSTVADRSGGGKPDDTQMSKRRNLSISYRPFQALYIIGSISRVTLPDRNTTLKNYAFNWSPFPYGTLQFNLSYNEELTSDNNGKSSTVVPSLRWNITSRAFLQLSYQLIKTESVLNTSDLKVFSVTARMIF